MDIKESTDSKRRVYGLAHPPQLGVISPSIAESTTSRRTISEDPPAEPKLAIPTLTVKKIAENYIFSDHHRAVANLCIIAFFYLLRVGEYTTPTCFSEVIGWYYRPNIHTQDSWHSHPII